MVNCKKNRVETTEKALATVIIPVYNRELLVEEAIKSVYHQSYRPIECIVVDDGSTDQSVAIVEELKTKYNSGDFSIKLYQQKNAGAPAARNVGIKNATGAYIQFLDSDDLLYADKLEIQIDFLSKNKNYDAVYGDWHHGTIEKHKLIKGEKWDDMISQFYGGRVIHTLSFLFRSSFMELLGKWDESLKRNQEVDFFLRGVLAGGQFDYVPELTGLWREHDGERIVNSSGALNALAFHDKWHSNFKELNLLTENRKKTIAYFYFWHTMELGPTYKSEALKYLYQAFELYKGFAEFNTKKMKVLRFIFGSRLAINFWYKRATYFRNQSNGITDKT
jgi:glycosyltransferase involved in cell wall biosynthesis